MQVSLDTSQNPLKFELKSVSQIHDYDRFLLDELAQTGNDFSGSHTRLN
jgi:hypothetical protein